jgi:hypothetical protein
MSSTRYSKNPDEFNQERYASGFERGLLANLVAKRARLLDSPADQEIVWFLQFLSWQEGGLERVAQEILKSYGNRIGTASMLTFGREPDQVYTAEQVRLIREECGRKCDFPVQGDDRRDLIDLEFIAGYRSLPPVETWPEGYSARVFIKLCERAVGVLTPDLARLCLEPKRGISAPWYFARLIEILRDYRDKWIQRRRAGIVTTAIGGRVQESLEYARDAKGLVLVKGFARTGKSFAAQAWCDSNPGVARFVEVPPGSSDIEFFRAIGAALGVSVNLNLKAHQIRERVEDVLWTGQIALVMDEGHRCWPEGSYRDALPFRVTWMMQAANKNVPVVIITTEQFFKNQARVVKKTGWADAQLIGRILHTEALPDSLSDEDLQGVATSMLPKVGAKGIDLLIEYAKSSGRYLGGLCAAVKRAQFIARRNQRPDVRAGDIARALKESLLPSDKALAAEMASLTDTRRGRSGRRMTPNRSDLMPLETPLKGPIRGGDLAGETPAADRTLEAEAVEA